MRFAALVLLLVAMLVLPAIHALAGDREKEEKAVRLHIEVLMHEAAAMKEAGRHDAAEMFQKRANELKARLRGGDRKREPARMSLEQAEKVLHGLEMGMEALKTIHREKELHALAKLADGLRARMRKGRAEKRGGKSEREVAEHRLEIMRMAFTALREGEKRDAMELMEHAIHAMELGLEGRRDDEAQEIRRTAPKVGAQIELLQLASKLWDGFGHEGKARIVGELAEELAAGYRARMKRGKTAKREGKPNREMERVEKRLKVIRLALPAFREAEKRNLVEQVEKIVHAYEVILSGRRDEEVREIWRNQPEREQQAELFGYAAHLYAEWGDEKRSAALKKLSLELLGKREGEAEHRGEGGAHKEARGRLERMHHRLRQIQEMVVALHEELEAFEREMAR